MNSNQGCGGVIISRSIKYLGSPEERRSLSLSHLKRATLTEPDHQRCPNTYQHSHSIDTDTHQDPSSLLLSYLISWCQATYGSPSFPLVPSGLMAGYLQMKRESSRMTSGPRMAVTTCNIWWCLVSSITQGYRRWTLWRLYWVYSLPGNTQTSAGSLLLTYLTSIPHLTKSGLQLRKSISGLLQLSISQHRQRWEEALLAVDLPELKWRRCHLSQTVSVVPQNGSG